MATPNQKAEERPISFILHNMAFGEGPVEVKLVVRPEDLSRTDMSRLTTTQTIGGAWVDNFGKSIPTVQISGTTGWGSDVRPDGLSEFQNLYDVIFQGWHRERAAVLDAGLDPDLVKLIFADKLDDFTWVVAPQNFVLKRNKARPLLSQYQISMIWLDDFVSSPLDAIDSITDLEAAGLKSLDFSLTGILDAIKNKITNFLGPLKNGFDNLLKITGNILSSVMSVIKSIKGVVGAFTSGLIGIATSITRAASNVANMVSSIMSLPQQIKAEFRKVGAAFNNAFCVLKNVFKKRKFISNYDDLYGASNCSSTAGGRPISKYASTNPLPIYFPQKESGVKITSSAKDSLSRLSNADPVLKPMTQDQIASDLNNIKGLEVVRI